LITNIAFVIQSEKKRKRQKNHIFSPLARRVIIGQLETMREDAHDQANRKRLRM